MSGRGWRLKGSGGGDDIIYRWDRGWRLHSSRMRDRGRGFPNGCRRNRRLHQYRVRADGGRPGGARIPEWRRVGLRGLFRRLALRMQFLLVGGANPQLSKRDPSWTFSGLRGWHKSTPVEHIRPRRRGRPGAPVVVHRGEVSPKAHRGI